MNDENQDRECNGHMVEADVGAHYSFSQDYLRLQRSKQFLPGLLGHILSKTQDKNMGEELLSERREKFI